MPNRNNGVDGSRATNSDMQQGSSRSGQNISGRRRVQSTLSAEEISKINAESQNIGKKDEFSPAVIVDISKSAKRLWQEALEKRGGIMNIAKPYFSSKLLDKLKEAGELGPSGIASLAYKRMVDIFI